MSDVPDYGIALFPHHQQLLRDSAISPEVARARGYVSVDTKAHLERCGITKSGRNTPGLLVPIWGTDGTIVTYQYRPDAPRINAKGKPVRYETPYGSTVRVDVPPPMREAITDADSPLWITEGVRKADAAASISLACVGLMGVDCWRSKGVALPEWNDIPLRGRLVVVCFDRDVMTKREVKKALDTLTGWLRYRGANVHTVTLPHIDGVDKVGLDDWLAAGGTLAELVTHVQSVDAPPAAPDAFTSAPQPPPPPPERATLHQVHNTFRRWLGAQYDLGAIDTVLAVAAVEQLDGDPPWLLLVSGAGNAKTETVMALSGVTRHIVSTVNSEAALLSGTPEWEKALDATGGLLREIGHRGLLVVKDFTSIISMNRDLRAQVLAALREIYDGRWSRRIGGEGGRVLDWSGRLVLLGAVTTAYDAAHAVIAAMGDRFALVRLDSADPTIRDAAHRQAMANVGHEDQMRTELAAVVAGLLAHTTPDRATLDTDAMALLGLLADLVTLARTAVERDYRGDVIDAHAPEMPTRFAKMLGQIMRGALAVGMDRTAAVAVAARVAGDSMPPLRLAILGDLLANPGSVVRDIRKRLDRPRTTIDRECQALHMLGLVTQHESGNPLDPGWHYRLTGRVHPDTLSILLTRFVSTHPLTLKKREGGENWRGQVVESSTVQQVYIPPTDISGAQDRPCCQGGPTQLRCQLCQASPTYHGHPPPPPTPPTRSPGPACRVIPCRRLHHPTCHPGPGCLDREG